MTDVEKIEKMQAQIDADKKGLAESQGRQKQLMANMKELTGFETIQENEEFLSKLDAEIAELEKSAKEKLAELEGLNVWSI